MKENKSLKDVSEYLKQLNYATEKINFIKKEIPDVRVKIYNNAISFYPKFAAKSVNQNYTHLDFNKTYDALFVSPYQIFVFTYEGKSEEIKVLSDPGVSRLLYIKGNYDSMSSKAMTYYLNFSKMTMNFERNQFNESMLNSCRLEILEFMKRHPNYKLNTKHLDPKLKKLMAFT